jgi:hypothetical protein
MQMDIDKVKDTIRKLLNLANNDAATEGEVNNAMRFAARLMEQHQLSEEDVKLNKTDEKLLDLENQTFAELSGWMGGNKFCHWESEAASFACAFVGGVKWYYVEKVRYKVNGIQKLFFDGKPMTKTKVTFYGIEEDVQLAFAVYNELIMTIAAMAKLKWGGVYRGPGRNYCEGFMDGLFGKWYDDQDTQKKIAKTSSSTALMVIDNRKLVVQRKAELATQWLEKRGMKLRSASKQQSYTNEYHAEARQEGRTDGQRYTSGATKAPSKAKITDQR